MTSIPPRPALPLATPGFTRSNLSGSGREVYPAWPEENRVGAGSEGTWKASGEPVVAPPLALLSGFRGSQAWLDRTHGEGTWEEGEAP